MKGKYLFTSFIMISLIMIVSASCGSSKTDKTSQETPVNYTGENINQLLTYTVPDGYQMDTISIQIIVQIKTKLHTQLFYPLMT